jgi:hypothetical protein
MVRIADQIAPTRLRHGRLATFWSRLGATQGGRRTATSRGTTDRQQPGTDGPATAGDDGPTFWATSRFDLGRRHGCDRRRSSERH